MSTSLVTVTAVSKSFGGTRALDDVSLEIAAGEVHALLGENGAGKSTLVKVLCGVVAADRGEISVGDTSVGPGDSGGTRLSGISTAFQELSLLPNLTVAENLLLGDEAASRGLWLRRRKLTDEAARRLDVAGLGEVDPTATTGTLPLAIQQKVEIARAVLRRPALLILDEPTATLPDVEWVFEHVRRVVAAGSSVLYITHKLAEIREIADRGTVLRNGRVVDAFDPRRATESELITQMLGRPVEVAFPERSARDQHAPVTLEARALRIGEAVREIDVEVRRREIVGIAALEGQGQRELFYALAGLTAPTSGDISFGGARFTGHGVRAAMRAGAALVPEERKTEGLFLDLSSATNVSVPALRSITRYGWLSRRRETAAAQAAWQRVGFVNGSRGPVSELSGGNQQKLVLARTMLTSAGNLLLFDPTRGVDAGTKLEIYRLIRDLADDGHSVLIYSTEIPELTGLCDRVYALYGGRVVRHFDDGRVLDSSVLEAVVGHGV